MLSCRLRTGVKLLRISTRVGVLAAALCVSFPADATAYINVGISGVTSGITTTLMCGSGSSPDCLSTYPGGVLTSAYTEPFSVAIGRIALEEGDNNFSFGSPYSGGLFSGTISYHDGILTGQDLQFSRADGSCRFASVGCQSVFASASTFNVTGGVPEPSTWMLMLIGFGAIGLALRRQGQQNLPVSVLATPRWNCASIRP